MKTLLVVPDGVSIRNFLLTGLPSELSQHGKVEVLVGAGLLGLPEVQAPGVDRATALAPYPERPLEAPLRRTLEYAHLRWCDTPATRFNLSRPIVGSLRSRAMRSVARSISALASSHGRVMRLVQAHDWMADRRPEVEDYVREIRDQEIDVVLCAHQRPIEVQPVVMAARRLGVPTATFIFSWDNLTTKARIAAPFDYYFVWSDQMADELVRFYPDVARSRVRVVGTPQFEPYADPSLEWGRDQFLATVGLEPDRPIICYSGGDTRTCPDDPLHLRLVCELIERKQILGNPQLVLRPAPVDISDRYDEVVRDHNVVMARPAWRAGEGGWSSAGPTKDDMALLVNLTRYADLNINMASTMTLDFALHDTPVVNLGFDADPSRNLAHRYYQYDHYRPVVEMGAARVARDANELAEAVNAYLANPSLDREGRERFVNHELRVRPGQSVPAIAEALRDIDRAARPDQRSQPSGAGTEVAADPRSEQPGDVARTGGSNQPS